MSRQSVIHYYSQLYTEDTRLESGLGAFEFARTKEIVGRYLPSSSGRIVDVGGGTGPYAFWLAGLGHGVHLLDLTPAHVRRAQEKAQHVAVSPISIQIGDACTLPFPDGYADLVLLLGPLYHLVDRDERVQALVEARRVLKAGGVVCCAAISRYASMLSSFCENGFDIPGFEAVVDRDLQDGQHQNPDRDPRLFTTSYLHRPQELRDEVEEADLICETVLGIEGPVGPMADVNAWVDERGRYYDLMLKYMRAVEAEESLLGASFHLLAIGRKA